MSVDLTGQTPRPAPDGTGRRVAIVSGRFNAAIVEELVRGATDLLTGAGVAEADITTVWAPGALEVPQLAKAVAEAGGHDAIVALGAVIKGGTYHFEVVCDASAAGLMQLSLQTDVVITNGILTVYDEEQARVRSGDDHRNKGAEAALAALETLAARATIR
ncbi:MAG: 6,7-dimethyl-8-ribityllumazine synthase [Acidimicrobiales bacterium]